jgi:hypothetical protein
VQIFALRRKRKSVVFCLDLALPMKKVILFLSIAVLAAGLSSCCAGKAVEEQIKPTYQAPR